MPEVSIRRAALADIPSCSAICYSAFSAVNAQHNFPCDFPGPEAAFGAIQHMFGHPRFYCVVAEIDGRIVGSNCLDERSVISGVGPITIDPVVQNHRVGRALMEAVMDRAFQRGAPGIRLVQAAFHNRSLALYTRLGFDIREPLSCLQGRTAQRQLPGCSVRPAQASDLPACNALSVQVHGFDRANELADGIQFGSAVVVERGGRITGYASSLAFFGYAIAETNLDLQAMIASADSFGGPGILLPSRNSSLLRWYLSNGLRIVQPMTLMSFGLYNQPDGAWFPSITF
ncbi:MAG: GNAT family N-acetyltransferase [Acidobacteriaceae bacterium]